MARADYILTVFDAEGNERRDENGDLGSAKAAARIRSQAITDIFVMSHGWNGDVPAAVNQYNGWTDAMLACPEDVEALRSACPNFKPLLVGFHWPSLAWGDETAVQSFAMDPGTTFDPAADTIERLGGSAEVGQAVREVFAEVAAAPNPNAITPGLNKAYQDLDAALHLGAGGVGAPPGEDREPFDSQRVFDALSSQPQSFGFFDSVGLLMPLRTLSFWCMKSRARRLGQTAGAGLVKALQSAASSAVRIHLMGHSFGCIVVTSIASTAGQPDLKPISSMVLVQGAMSLWSFAASIPSNSALGYFHATWKGRKVTGPIVTTQSQFDTAVKTLYPIAAGAALEVDFASAGFPSYGGVGTFGIQGLDCITGLERMLGPKEQYGFEPGHIYNIHSDNVIFTGTGMIGAHSDVMHAEVGHLVWQAAMAK